tara:strand:+ start:524 stop:1534 length:1011 start_codon:yes stop_codon:yes gene_type:complete
MIHRFKKLNAFVTGCLVTTVVFGYPSQLLAQTTTTNDPIQGVTSTTQSPPTTTGEINDAITGVNAGLDPVDAIGYKPYPIREHTAFLTSMWDELFDSAYVVDQSYITTGEWITGPTGVLNAANENGDTLEVDITLSLEVLPEQFSEIDQISLDTLASVSARIGMAWTTMTNDNGVDANILVWWYQWNSPSGVETAIGPIDILAQDDIDLLAAVIPLMDGFFDNPFNYNIDNYNPDILSAWSRFRTAVLTAVVGAVATIVTAAVVAAIVVTAPATLAGVATVIAGAALHGAIWGSAVVVVGTTGVAYLNLVDDLNNSGNPASVVNVVDNLQTAYQLR